jgi:hypothetical protein
MQHLDEGTIHSWLDGALSSDEAARVEAHVAECPQCAAAVAEARGFIAASSRILTALDDVPRGVIPVAAPVKRVSPMVWRIAATVMVVAAGSLVVVQNRGSDEPLEAVSAVQAITSQQPTAVSEAGSSADGTAARPADAAASNSAADEVPTSTSLTSKAPAAAFSGKAAAGNARRGTTMGDDKALAEGSAARTRQPAVASDLAAAVPTPAVPTLAPTTAPARVVELRARDEATEPERLKVVGSPRQLGAKVTLYEVAPGDTVTLTESMSVRLESVVITGAAAGAQMMAPQATAKSVAPPSTAPPVPTPAPVLRPGAAITPRSIKWIDPATGNALTLTGRMPEARLQEIRTRIERERAAAATEAKRIP